LESDLPSVRRPFKKFSTSRASLDAQLVYPADYLGGFIVDDPLLRVVRVLLVAVGRRTHGVASIAAHLLGTAYLAADVLGVPLVDDIAEWGKLIILLVAVHSIIDCDKMNIVFWEENFTIMDKTTK